jgi:hypothetical protein
MPVSGVRPRSANARHECFVMHASVTVKTAETAELDDLQPPRRPLGRRSLRPGESRSVEHGCAGRSWSSIPVASERLKLALAQHGGCCTNPRRAHWSLLRAASKSRRSLLARGAPCPASALRAPSACVTASAAQVFADGFVQQPPWEATVLSWIRAVAGFPDDGVAGDGLVSGSSGRASGCH